MELALDGGGRRTAHQLVRDALWRAILTGQIKGGTRLVQTDLAERLQVSTTPVREALRDLATEGLIRLDAHRGAVVQELSQEEAREIYELRLILEPVAMRLAVERITEEELEMASALQARADVEHDPASWVELNYEFHRAFIEAGKSRRLRGILSNLQQSAAMYVAASVMEGEHRLEEANAQHHELLNAVRARDADKAVEVVLSHLGQTMASISWLKDDNEGRKAVGSASNAGSAAE